MKSAKAVLLNWKNGFVNTVFYVGTFLPFSYSQNKQNKIIQNYRTSPQQWLKENTAIYMGLPPSIIRYVFSQDNQANSFKVPTTRRSANCVSCGWRRRFLRGAYIYTASLWEVIRFKTSDRRGESPRRRFKTKSRARKVRYAESL